MLDSRTGVVGLAVACIAFAASWLLPADLPAQPDTQRGEWILALAPGEALRVIGVSNPWAQHRGRVIMTYRILTKYGEHLFESPAMEVAHGAMAFSDVFRRDLSHPGEPGTGRLQLRVIYDVVGPAGSRPSDFTPLAEVFDLVTGRTAQRTGPIADVLYSAGGNSP